MRKIPITTDYVTLGQFLKLADLISTGGEAKMFLASDIEVLVNGEVDKRRGRKLRNSDIVKVDGKEFIIKQENDN